MGRLVDLAVRWEARWERRRAAGPGRVVLVGGGPGDEGLLTMRGVQELARADVVVLDRLGPRVATERLCPQAEVIDVGKTPYHHPVPQEEINAILVRRATAGQRVARLKGGDPFVFGRGGEELLACRQAGIPVEVVPGVSSALAAPAAAGIPVTHRGVSRGVLVISGHDSLEAETLAGWPHTVVVLMGMARLRELTAALIEAGRDPQTPAAVVHAAWTPQERSVRAPLSGLARAVDEAALGNPAVIVIGEVADVLQVSSCAVTPATDLPAPAHTGPTSSLVAADGVIG
ncbi:uroporphyrinogen-III C-methyltransferase [Actinomycetota bacterium]